MRILHLSDIHLSNHSAKATSRMIKNLAQLLHTECKVIPIDFIVISGDMIDKGGITYGNTATALKVFDEIVLKPLLKAAKIDKSKVVICPGNHEVEGAKIDSESEEKFSLNSSRLDSTVIGSIYYNEFSCNTEYGRKLKARVEAYEQYRDTFFTDMASFQKGALEHSVKFDYGIHKVGFTSFNSIWRCDEHGVGKPYVLGHHQINESKEFINDCDLKIAIMHNPPGMLADFEKDEVRKLLSTEYHILLLGHAHYGDEGEITPPGGDKITFLQSPGIVVYNSGNNHTYANGVRLIDYDFDTAEIFVYNYVMGADEIFKHDRNYINEGVWNKQIKDHDSILPIASSLLKQHTHSSPFISAPVYEDIIHNLRDNKIKEILLVALTGLGKTRLLYEAFNPDNDYAEAKSCFYCNLSGNKEKVLNQSERLMNKFTNGCTIILDNCPTKVFKAVVKLRNEINPKVRIIGVNNDISDENLRELNYSTIPLEAVRGEVENYVNQVIDDSGQNPTIKQEIIKIADGFPMLAVALVDKFKRGQDVNIHDADYLVQELLGVDLDKEEEQLMMMVALFQPFPTTLGAMNLLIASENLSTLSQKGTLQRTDIINRIKYKFSNSLLDISEAGWNVRPYPLAIHMATRWFNRYGTPEIFENLLNEIEAIPNPPRQLIIDCMAKRLEKMDESYAAQELIGQLTEKDGVFNSEKAVSSEVGSRLFLAMSTVNPSKVAECLNQVISNQSPEWVQSLKINIRRNIVWTLTKLVFDRSSFDQAIRSLSILANYETDFNISNNSVNLFTQVFRIMLPGTEVSLKERGFYLKEFAIRQTIGQGLLLTTLRNAYSFGHAVRFGGNSFGTKIKKDYQPNNFGELSDYWDICNSISMTLLDKGEGLDEFSEIIKNNLFRWSMGGVLGIVRPMVEKVFERNGYALNLTNHDIDRISSRLRTNGQKELMDWMEKMRTRIVPNTFVSKLIDATKEFHQYKRHSSKDFFKDRDEFFTKYAGEFLISELYKSQDEVAELLKEKDSYSLYFAPVLGSTISEIQLKEFLSVLKEIILSDRTVIESPFLAYFLPIVFRHFDIEDFLSFIKKQSPVEYIGLLARCEDSNLSMLSRLTEEMGYDRIDYFLPIYLYRCNRYVGESTTKLLDFLNENFQCSPYDITNFLIRNFGFLGSEDKEHLPVVKEILKKYDIKGDTTNTQHEYWQLATELLKADYDKDFARWINNKLIDNTITIDSSYGRLDFYDFMLPKHSADIWSDLSNALFQDDFTFYYAVKDEFGSGFSFGSGFLFRCDEDMLKQLLVDYPDHAPIRLAGMCPVFDNNSDSEKCSFSNWGRYLIDHYPTREVLNAFLANTDTYQWGGSIVPLLKNKIDAFSDFNNHESQFVRDWANSNLKRLKEELKTAQQEEDFMRQHYGY